MQVIIRPMVTTDYEQVRKVDVLTQIQYLQEKWDTFSSEEQEKHLVSRKSEFQINVDTGYCFVALDEDINQIIGFILAHETLPFHGTLYIRYIGLNPDIQGKGVGMQLYKKLIEQAKESDIKEIWALINVDNSKSMRLHEKMGFTLNDRKEAVLDLNKK
jgi:L-amino acid N-acyltransferase YncA